MQEEKKEEEEETEFKKETDPSKLGKSLSESINKKTIIGTLLMLMILPLLSRSDIDYSINYALREVFWFGRSSCTDPSGFYCGNPTWLASDEGWYEVLRGVVRAAENQEQTKLKEVLWIYVPDFRREGTLNSIKSVPNRAGEAGNYWEETEPCAGFVVSDSCPWRYEEMSLVSYTPKECLQDKALSCEQLVAYIRVHHKLEKQEEAMMQFCTTVFTCFVLACASLTVSGDIEVIVIHPIKKIVDII